MSTNTHPLEISVEEAHRLITKSPDRVLLVDVREADECEICRIVAAQHIPMQQIPAQLNRVARRCLEKRPDRRFQTASDLGFAIEALSVFSGSQQTQALRAWPESEAKKTAAAIFSSSPLVI